MNTSSTSSSPISVGDHLASFRKMALRGSFWTLAGFGASQSIRLVGNLLLTRLLFPEVFGVMALVEMAMRAIQMFSDLGLNTGAVRDARGDDPEFLDTAWTVGLVHGACLFLITCLIAYPFSVLYEEPSLAALLPVTGLGALLNALTSTSVITLRRRVELKSLVVWEVGSQLLGLIATLVLAWYLQSVWALVLGGLLRTAWSVVLSQRLIPGRRLRVCWDKSAVWTLVHFGKWLFLSTAITFLIQQGDRAILGLYLNKTELGLFAIAAVWSRMSTQALLRVNSHVLFPIYSQLFNKGVDSLRGRVLQARRALLSAFVPLMCVLSIFGSDLIRLLYDPRYVGAGWMLQVLSMGAIGALVSTTMGGMMLAAGDSRRFSIVQALRGGLLIACMLIGWQFGEVPGIICGIAVSKWLDYPIVIWGIRKYDLWMPGLDLSAYLAAAVVVGAGLGIRLWFGVSALGTV